MNFDTLPQSIQDTATAIREIEYKYPANAGKYDRTVGDNIRLGKLQAKLWRLCAEHNLDEKSVLWAISNRQV